MSDDEWKEQKEGTVFEFTKLDDEVEGKLIHVQNDVGMHKSKLYSLKKDNGDIVKIWGSVILDSKMMGIDFGTKIKVVFKGLKKPEKGMEYKDFVVFKKTFEVAKQVH